MSKRWQPKQFSELKSLAASAGFTATFSVTSSPFSTTTREMFHVNEDSWVIYMVLILLAVGKLHLETRFCRWGQNCVTPCANSAYGVKMRPCVLLSYREFYVLFKISRSCSNYTQHVCDIIPAFNITLCQQPHIISLIKEMINANRNADIHLVNSTLPSIVFNFVTYLQQTISLSKARLS